MLCSLVQHIVGCLLEFAPAIHVVDVLGDVRLAVGGRVLRWALLLGGRMLVHNHPLGASSVFLGRRAVSLVSALSSGGVRLCKV